MPTYLWSLATASPEHTLTAEDTRILGRQLFAALFGADLAAFDQIVASTGIVARQVVRPLAELVAPRPIDASTRLYLEACGRLGEQALAAALADAGVAPSEVDALVLASSTGYAVPSLDAYLVNRLGLPADTWRLPYTSLGCAGGAGGLARAAEAVAARGRDATVAFVSVEAPSLTFRPADRSMANAIAATLFGDGAAALVVRGRPRRDRPSLRVRATASWLQPETYHLMGSHPMPDGYLIQLSPEVPAAAARDLPRLVGGLCAGAHATARDLSFHAVHPGGPRVLEHIAAALQLGPGALAASWAVLRDHGNMSSATVLFTLAEALRAAPPAPGALGLLAAFGPGFAAELVLLEAVAP